MFKPTHYTSINVDTLTRERGEEIKTTWDMGHGSQKYINFQPVKVNAIDLVKSSPILFMNLFACIEISRNHGIYRNNVIQIKLVDNHQQILEDTFFIFSVRSTVHEACMTS